MPDTLIAHECDRCCAPQLFSIGDTFDLIVEDVEAVKCCYCGFVEWVDAEAMNIHFYMYGDYEPIHISTGFPYVQKAKEIQVNLLPRKIKGMKLNHISEMAMGKVRYNMPGNKALSNQKLNTKFEQVLDRHADFLFNFIFNTSQANGKRDGIIAEIETAIRSEGYEVKNAITFVLTCGFDKTEELQGDGRTVRIMPLTPWTRIHRACHGLIGDAPEGRYNKNFW